MLLTSVEGEIVLEIPQLASNKTAIYSGLNPISSLC